MNLNLPLCRSWRAEADRRRFWDWQGANWGLEPRQRRHGGGGQGGQGGRRWGG
jgi:hypothetical protein